MKRNIAKRLLVAFVAAMLVMTASLTGAQLVMAFQGESARADEMFTRIERIIASNDANMNSLEDDFGQTSLTRARAAAFVLNSLTFEEMTQEKMLEVADLVDVDELHVFSPQGEIVYGTVPAYYGYTFDSGEQMQFFRPMLSDSSLEMCQGIEPNTAEGKAMQYAAVWLPNETAIVQIGMVPARMLSYVESNDISHVLSMVSVSTASQVLAAETESGVVLGSCDPADMGTYIDDIGISLDEVLASSPGFVSKVEGTWTWLSARNFGDVAFVRGIPIIDVVAPVLRGALIALVYCAAIAAFSVVLLMRYIDKHIVRSIDNINGDLSRITSGDYTVVLSEDGTPEFAELSNRVNKMVGSITSATGKVSLLLDAMEGPVAIFEYSSLMDRVIATKRLAEALHMPACELDELLADPPAFEAMLQDLLVKAEESSQGICRVADADAFVRIEVYKHDGITTGIVFDVTNDVLERLALEHDRDYDFLTNLAARRLFFEKIEQLGDDLGNLGSVMLVMADADALKRINDEFGHSAGDAYLRTIAEGLDSCDLPNKTVARLGGDEFALVAYGFSSVEESRAYASCVREAIDAMSMTAPTGKTIPVRCSLGFAFYPDDGKSLSELLSTADAAMYREKRSRYATRGVAEGK